ncbi:MAG: hypothetical protein AB7E72_04710 [Lysobacterales bacterium]
MTYTWSFVVLKSLTRIVLLLGFLCTPLAWGQDDSGDDEMQAVDETEAVFETPENEAGDWDQRADENDGAQPEADASSEEPWQAADESEFNAPENEAGDWDQRADENDGAEPEADASSEEAWQAADESEFDAPENEAGDWDQRADENDGAEPEADASSEEAWSDGQESLPADEDFPADDQMQPADESEATEDWSGEQASIPTEVDASADAANATAADENGQAEGRSREEATRKLQEFEQEMLAELNQMQADFMEAVDRFSSQNPENGQMPESEKLEKLAELERLENALLARREAAIKEWHRLRCAAAVTCTGVPWQELGLNEDAQRKMQAFEERANAELDRLMNEMTEAFTNAQKAYTGTSEDSRKEKIMEQQALVAKANQAQEAFNERNKSLGIEQKQLLCSLTQSALLDCN